jgi:hypothetical protein
MSLPELASVAKNLVKNDRTTSPLLPTFGVKENGYFNSSKRLNPTLQARRVVERTPNPLYYSNFTAFAKVLTPPSDHRHVQVC